MSARCSIHFTLAGSDEVQANVYRYHDGYPSTVQADLEKFFQAVLEQTSDTRFNDPEYLAARYVVWQSRQYAVPGKPLAFTGVGVQVEDPADINYIHDVICAGRDNAPVVISREAGQEQA